jgi:hypothetical protein
VSDETELSVFLRLRQAVADAEQEEADFAAEVTADDPSGEASYRAFSEWTSALFDSAQALRVTPDMRRLFREEIAAALDDPATIEIAAQLPFVKPLLEVRLAKIGVDRIEKGTARLYNLLGYLVEADLQPIAQSYFASVARLYIWGFNNEAVVLARSALEAALEDRLEKIASMPYNERHGDLVDLIRTVGPDKLRLLDRSAFTDAEMIRKAANQSLHIQLGSQELDALQAIKALGRILRQLFPDSPNRDRNG